MAFYLRFSHDGEDLYPRLLELAESGQVPEDNRVRYEVLKHFGYFVTESSEHFAEYVPWFVKRDRPELISRVQHSARRVPAPVRRADRGLGCGTGAAGGRRGVRGAAELRVRGDDHPLDRDGQAAGDLRQRAERRVDRRSARRVHGGGAVPGRRERRAAHAHRRVAAAARRADPHERERAGADGRGRAHRSSASTCTTPRCSTRTPRPSSTSTRSTRWSTRCWTRTASGSRR